MSNGAFKALFFALLLTVTGFAAGFAAGTWRERHRPLPPPPGGFMTEFGVGGGGGPGARGGLDRAGLVASIERIRPQIEDYRQRLAAIDDEFDHDLEGILTPGQRDRYEERLRRRAADRAALGHPGDPVETGHPLTDEQVMRYLQSPFRSLAMTVIVQLRVDSLARDLKLDDAQRAKIRDLLRVRREKFIELVDSVPPPSVLLSRLAPMAQRLGPGRGGRPPLLRVPALFPVLVPLPAPAAEPAWDGVRRA